MDEELIDGVQDDLNLEEEDTSLINDDEIEESPEELKLKLQEAEAKVKKAEEIAENQRIRAEKAEKSAKKPKETETKSDYSLKDIRALNNIADEDLDDFLDLSKRFGLSPAEAAVNKDVQAVLKNRSEERKTAEVANVGSGRRGASTVSGANLLEKASTSGALPESDKEMEALARARYGIKS